MFAIRNHSPRDHDLSKRLRLPAAASLLGACLALAQPAASGTTLDAAQRTTFFIIDSTELGETRTLHVRTPPGLEPGRAYATVYVLDAEWNFEYVAAYLDNLGLNGVYPPLIVTGIVNVNRNRDYVPRTDAHFPHTGGADAFLAFVEREWIPAVQSRYPASGRRVLVGHSFGGVFALHTLFRRPELFDAHLAMGSSAWIANRVLFEEAGELFSSGANPDAFVWMAVGEGDGGPTVPSGKDLAALFELEAPASLEWTFSLTPRTDHFTNFISGTHEAFMALFPTWGAADAVTARARDAGADGIRAWFSEQEARLGWRFVPPWFDLGVAAIGLSRDESTREAAIALTDALQDHYPDHAFIAVYSASVFENIGMLDRALAETRRAIVLTESQQLDPNELQMVNLVARRDRLERLLTQNRTASD